jgi:hypothetical protein
MLKDIKLKNGLNKFEVNDIVVGRGNTWEIINVYNDFTYSMRHYYDSSFILPVVSDEGFKILALKRILIIEKWKRN